MCPKDGYSTLSAGNAAWFLIAVKETPLIFCFTENFPCSNLHLLPLILLLWGSENSLTLSSSHSFLRDLKTIIRFPFQLSLGKVEQTKFLHLLMFHVLQLLVLVDSSCTPSSMLMSFLEWVAQRKNHQSNAISQVLEGNNDILWSTGQFW